jgi:stage V sporulation protein G
MPTDNEGRAKLYADIAHPINSGCREMIQDSVVREFKEEVRRAEDPSYVSRYDDFDLDFDESRATAPAKRAKGSRVDQAHDTRTKHAPRTGGASEQAVSNDQGPTAPLRSSSKPQSVSPETGFGSGVFPKK